MSSSVKCLQENPLLQAILPIAADLGLTLYPVGGCVREALLEQLPPSGIPKDMDCLVLNALDSQASSERLANALAEQFKATAVTLHPELGIYRVVFHEGTRFGAFVLEEKTFLDLSDALENSLTVDLARRDLTINALALDTETGTLIDQFQGHDDLLNHRVRMISEANMQDDPIRLLRVFRFGALLDSLGKPASYDSLTLEAVQKHAALINTVAVERVHDELYKFFSVSTSFPALSKMAETGFLERLFPEMTPMHAIPPNGHHHLGLFEHTIELVRQAERLIFELPETEQVYFHQPFENTLVTHFGLVKFACLFHDLGKPDTKEVKETQSGERFTYYGHDQVSAEMTEVICDRLKTGNAIKAHLMHLTRWHLYPCQFGTNSPRRSILRFYRRMKEATPDILLLALADRHSTLGADVTPEIVQREHENLLWLLENYRAEQANLKQPRLLNGHEVMALLNLKPGEHLKAILAALEEAQQLGEIVDKKAAEAWLLKQYAGTINQ